jgi:hypothetical protein
MLESVGYIGGMPMMLPMYESLTPKQKLNMAMEVLKGQLEKDNDGQFIIYTGLTEDEHGEIVPFKKEE